MNKTFMLVLYSEMKKLILDFHLISYHAGINTAFSEVLVRVVRNLH